MSDFNDFINTSSHKVQSKLSINECHSHNSFSLQQSSLFYYYNTKPITNTVTTSSPSASAPTSKSRQLAFCLKHCLDFADWLDFTNSCLNEECIIILCLHNTKCNVYDEVTILP